MKGIHPNLGLAVVLAVVAAWAGTCGCSHNQTGVSNPFLAPDRVPPPSTRVLAPGTAQPYYPGDPLPVMQSAAPAAAPVAAPNAAAAAPAEPKKFAFSNEPTVAIPSDDNSLRFELPAPPEPEPTPTTPIANAAGSPASLQSGVVPAIYSAAVTAGQPANNILPAAALAEPAATGPWRSPQIPATTQPAVYAPVPQPIVSPLVAQPVVMPSYVIVPPMSAAPPGMDVTLRAVPSPPPEPVESSTPRIRIPGYPAPPVPMTTVPPTASSSSSDGFRPRSSMR